jgi:hypothetical protein
MSFAKYKKLILSLVLIVIISSLGVFVFGVEEAKASWVMSKFVKGVVMAFGFVLLGMLWLAGQLLNVAAGLVSGILSYTGFVKASIVTTGWEIVRDLVNMFFVLILLVIAFATILRIETYGMKQILWKLIVAALLINFSLVLAGPIIDFSQVLTQFFIDESGGKNFTKNISTALQISKIDPSNPKECDSWDCSSPRYTECLGNCLFSEGENRVCEEECKLVYCKCDNRVENEGSNFDVDWGSGITDTINVIMGLAVSILFTIFAIFAFFAFAFFLIVRIIMLWFLLILAPIAWFFWILPATQKLFSQWWDTFIKWTFFAPAYMFFVYLALKTFPTFISDTLVDASDTGQAVSDILPNILSFEYLLRFILVSGILIGGLIFAQKMSIYGAQGAISIAQKAGKGTGEWIGRKGQRMAYRPAGAVGRGIGKAGDFIGRGKYNPLKLTGLPQGIKQLGRAPRALQEKERAAFAGAEKKYKGFSTDNLAVQRNVVDGRDRAAIDKIVAERGEFGKLNLSDKQAGKALKLAKRYGQQGSILKTRPDLAKFDKEKPSDSDPEAVRKQIRKIKPDDLKKFSLESFESSDVQEAIKAELKDERGVWGSSHLSKLSETNPELFIKIKQDVIDRHRDKGVFRSDVENYLNSGAGQAIYGKLNRKAEEAPFSNA